MSDHRPADPCVFSRAKRAERRGAGADAEFYGCPATPCELEISRRSEFTLNVALDGYHPASMAITSGFGGGGGAAVAGAAAAASGGYVVAYATYAAAASTMLTVATLGASTSAAGLGA